MNLSQILKTILMVCLQAVDLLEACVWTDKLVELQLWTRLSYMAFTAKEYMLVAHCSNKALAFAATGTAAKGKKQEG